MDRVGKQGATRALPTMNADQAVVRVAGDSAFAEPVFYVTVSDARVYRLAFRRAMTTDGSCADTKQTGVRPIEMVYPELGAAAVQRNEAWSDDMFRWVRAQLRADPPQNGNPRKRMQALHTLDEPLHLRSSHLLHSTRRFLREGADEAIASFRDEQVTEGATIWQIYNQGWIVKTASHAWGHDLYAGPDSASLTDEQIDALVEPLDALFISHWHGDHASVRVLARATAKGVPVLIPPVPSGGWGEYIRRDIEQIGEGATVIEGGAEGEVSGLRYRACPGHQDDLENNCFAVTADGMTILHTGDQRQDADTTWIAHVGDEITVDVLLPHLETIYEDYVFEGIRPRWVLPGHLVELGHGFDGRLPYDRAYDIVIPLRGIDWRVLAWGEHVHIPPR